jgi:hypothetical protein
MSIVLLFAGTVAFRKCARGSLAHQTAVWARDSFQFSLSQVELSA